MWTLQKLDYETLIALGLAIRLCIEGPPTLFIQAVAIYGYEVMISNVQVIYEVILQKSALLWAGGIFGHKSQQEYIG